MIKKVKHYVCPVCSGKTTKAQEIQLNDPENTLLIEVLDSTDIERIYEKHIKGCRFKTIVIDNFLKLYNKKRGDVNKIMQKMKAHSEEIILFSTPDKLYDKKTDKEELKSKFLDGKSAQVIYEKFYPGMSKNDRAILTSSLPASDFESKVLGVIFSSQKMLTR